MNAAVPGGESGGDGVEDRCCAAQRGGGDQRSVAGKVFAQQSHPVPVQDILGSDRHGVEVEDATDPAGKPGRWDRLAAQAGLGGVHRGGGQAAVRGAKEHHEHGGLGQSADPVTGEAVEAAARLGADSNHRFTAFGPTGVGLYRISIARVLGDYGTAVEAAQRINPAGIALVERHARYWSDIARSFHEWNKPEPCYRALLAAELASPDEVHYRKPIQQITTSLLQHPTAHTLPGLRAFATRTGALE